ncbi:MAG: T9SS type A sorting domain-containing protein, partial [Flavobacteriaceae bacterium]|nr:T9SS type A sorting domain-containing protein [Flavobacteriaceae bacterium]
MKNNYTLLWLMSLLSFSLVNAQSCPETLGNSSSDVLIHFNIDEGSCTDFPDTIQVEGRTFDKKDCETTNLMYDLVAGSPLPSYDSFSVDLGFGVCDYLEGELRRETLSIESFEEKINSLRIYPNPVLSGDQINISFAENVTAKVYIYDLTGKLVMKDNISSSSTKTLNISAVNSGI